MAKLANLALGVALACVCLSYAATAVADDKIDVSGTWNFEIDIAGNQGTPVFTFKQDGEKLTGKYKGQFGEKDIVGKIKGNEIEFSFEIQDDAKAVYTGTIEKDTMKGKANYADQASGEWTAKKAPAK
jgi:opacity protein-like surface antigen